MSPTCVGLIVDDLVNNELHRRSFVLFFVLFRFVALLLLILFWIFLLLLFFCWCFLLVAPIRFFFLIVDGDDVFHFNVIFCWALGFLAIDGGRFNYFHNFFPPLRLLWRYVSRSWYFFDLSVRLFDKNLAVMKLVQLTRTFDCWCNFIPVVLGALSCIPKLHVLILVDGFQMLRQTCITAILIPVLCFLQSFFLLLHGILYSMFTFMLEFSLRLFTWKHRFKWYMSGWFREHGL